MYRKGPYGIEPYAEHGNISTDNRYHSGLVMGSFWSCPGPGINLLLQNKNILVVLCGDGIIFIVPWTADYLLLPQTDPSQDPFLDRSFYPREARTKHI